MYQDFKPPLNATAQPSSIKNRYLEPPLSSTARSKNSKWSINI